jgi:phosphate starvation-inducible PhoH-like protein
MYKISAICKSSYENNIKLNRESSNIYLTANHYKYRDFLNNNKYKIVIGHGVSGTSKTYTASKYAISSLINRNINKIVITRPNVILHDTEDIGYLPGTLQSKMEPWLKPIYDCFLEHITVDNLLNYISKQKIEICPLSHIRGRTFHDSWIIADEVQNTTPLQMKALLTRVGRNSKIVLTGDNEQTDMANMNGLSDFIMKYQCLNDNELIDISSIGIVEFSEEDVVRSEISKLVLNIYKKN